MSYDKNDKKYYLRHKEKLIENQRKYRSRPEVRERMRKYALERSRRWYSIPENRAKRSQYNKEWWQKKILELEQIAGRVRPKICELCGEEDTICFDHDHLTGKFRGWICKRCNTVLGKVNDNKELLQKLINYLG